MAYDPGPKSKRERRANLARYKAKLKSIDNYAKKGASKIILIFGLITGLGASLKSNMLNVPHVARKDDKPEEEVNALMLLAISKRRRKKRIREANNLNAQKRNYYEL